MPDEERAAEVYVDAESGLVLLAFGAVEIEADATTAFRLGLILLRAAREANGGRDDGLTVGNIVVEEG